MIKVNYMDNLAEFSLCKDVFEKFGERRLIGQGEYFAHSLSLLMIRRHQLNLIVFNQTDNVELPVAVMKRDKA